MRESNSNRNSGSRKGSQGRPSKGKSQSGKSFGERSGGGSRPSSGRTTGGRAQGGRFSKPDNSKKPFRKKPFFKKRDDDKVQTPVDPNIVRLNKYLANAGVSSRREADELIKAGLVQVNGQVVTEMGFKVNLVKDVVKFNDSHIAPEKKVYYVLNKPKGFITTVDDPKARKTVMELVANTGPERIYPVGRLDRKTTGVLLFTNDGELAKHLTHPSHGVRKIYQVVLDKNLEKKDFAAIEDGLELEDGSIKVDQIAYVEGKNRKHVGVILHSGRNRIVRRIFGHLGYEVTQLDRVSFAGITKKSLSRGQWRRLNEKEVNFLKMH